MTHSLIAISTILCGISAFTLRDSVYTTAALRLVALAVAVTALLV